MSEEKLLMGLATNKYGGAGITNTDIGVYGEVFETVFKPKVSSFMSTVLKHMNANNPFELS